MKSTQPLDARAHCGDGESALTEAAGARATVDLAAIPHDIQALRAEAASARHHQDDPRADALEAIAGRYAALYANFTEVDALVNKLTECICAHVDAETRLPWVERVRAYSLKHAGIEPVSPDLKEPR